VTVIRWPWRRACRLARDPPNLLSSASKGSARARRPPSALQAPSRPGRDLPGGPFSLPAMLLGGSGDGVSVVTGVLTTLLTIWLLNALGGRLRVVADVLRPPDVFFRLERPG
jgi:hypothetical protein